MKSRANGIDGSSAALSPCPVLQGRQNGLAFLDGSVDYRRAGEWEINSYKNFHTVHVDDVPMALVRAIRDFFRRLPAASAKHPSLLQQGAP